MASYNCSVTVYIFEIEGIMNGINFEYCATSFCFDQLFDCSTEIGTVNRFYI